MFNINANNNEEEFQQNFSNAKLSMFSIWFYVFDYKTKGTGHGNICVLNLIFFMDLTNTAIHL